MFREATSDEGHFAFLQKFDVSTVRTMEEMFQGVDIPFTGLARWNVGNVENMTSMFDGATHFNEDISRWNVQNVKEMFYMFRGATAFRQNLRPWVLKSNCDMYGMFDGATSFDAPTAAPVYQWQSNPQIPSIFSEVLPSSGFRFHILTKSTDDYHPSFVAVIYPSEARQATLDELMKGKVGEYFGEFFSPPPRMNPNYLAEVHFTVSIIPDEEVEEIDIEYFYNHIHNLSAEELQSVVGPNRGGFGRIALCFAMRWLYDTRGGGRFSRIRLQTSVTLYAMGSGPPAPPPPDERRIQRLTAYYERSFGFRPQSHQPHREGVYMETSLRRLIEMCTNPHEILPPRPREQ